MRIGLLLPAAVLFAAFSSAAADGLEGRTIPIAHAATRPAQAEVVIEGVVMYVTEEGALLVRDTTGWLRLDLGATTDLRSGRPGLYEHVRASGTLAAEDADPDFRAMSVARLERPGVVRASSGPDPSPPAAQAPDPTP